MNTKSKAPRGGPGSSGRIDAPSSINAGGDERLSLNPSERDRHFFIIIKNTICGILTNNTNEL